jgi:hypothetical protein
MFVILVRTTLFVPTDVLWSSLSTASLLSHSVPVLFASRLLLLTICSYLLPVRLEALVLTVYI